MDPELRERFTETLEGARQSGLLLTPHATTLLTVMMDSSADDPTEQVRKSGVLRDVQFRAIERIPALLRAISQKYPHKPINAVMVLNFLPRLMEGFCPPFERSPSY
jgi:hypothetical protein